MAPPPSSSQMPSCWASVPAALNEGENERMNSAAAGAGLGVEGRSVCRALLWWWLPSLSAVSLLGAAPCLVTDARSCSGVSTRPL